MRWGMVLVAAAVAAAAAAALVPMESVAQRVPALASPLSTNADRFDLSGPDGRGGLADAASLTVGVAPGTYDDPPTGGATGKPPPDSLALPVRLSGRVQLVSEADSSTGTLCRLRDSGRPGCSLNGAFPGAGVVADTGGDESRWEVEAVTTLGAEKFVRLRSVCSLDNGAYLGRANASPDGTGPAGPATWVGDLDPAGFSQQWGLTRGEGANCTVLTSRWEAATAVLTRDRVPGAGGSGPSTTLATSVSLQPRRVGSASQCWSISRA